MRKYAIAALAVVALGAAIALSQVVTFPPPAGMIGLVCKYNTSPVTLTDNQIGFVQCSDSTAHIGGSGGGSGGSVTQGTVPWVDSITTWATGTLGAMANYGTSPGAVLVPGVNAFVTNVAHTIVDSGAVTATLNAETTKVIGVTTPSSQYPSGAVPVTASATGTTGATTATLAASASIKTYICGFSIRANATSAATANSTVTGTITGTLNFTQWTAPLASGIGLTEQVFMPCVPSSAINTGIAVISAAPGTGGVVSVSAWGYQL
jgi:hypothetical protein